MCDWNTKIIVNHSLGDQVTSVSWDKTTITRRGNSFFRTVDGDEVASGEDLKDVLYHITPNRFAQVIAAAFALNGATAVSLNDLFSDFRPHLVFES